ncbi:hypothetical protein ABPG72_008991 [Tetrahymena utriculariae]
MGDQGEYDQNDQQNYEESYESDIQKKFERELQNMERSRQKETYDNQEDYNDGYQNEQNQEDDQQNQNNEDQGEEYDKQQEGYNQEGNDGEYQDQDQNVEKNQKDQSYEQQHQQDYDQQNHSQAQEDNGENYDNEEVSKKVETHQNDDDSITTVTYTTVTKTKKVDLQDYSMPTIEEQDTDKLTIPTKHGLSQDKSQSPNQNKNIFNQLDEVSQQKLIIKSLQEELKDEREINTIQALEIESLKQLVRKLQGNIETLQLQFKGEQNTQQISSPYKTENSKRSEPIFNQVKIYQSMEVKSTKQDISNINKTQTLKNNEEEEMDASENGQKTQEKLYLTTFQKSLWIPQKEKMAEKQLYEIHAQEQEQKSKTLRPLKKITPKDKQQLQQSKINNDQNSKSDVESKNKKKTDASIFDEELTKIAKQNREQFAMVYKQNKLKLRQEMFEDYQKRKQELLEKRENRNKLDANWQESLHPVSRAKSVKNISVNVFNMSDKQHQHDLRTPSYMERQMQTIKKEMDKINPKSISNLPTLENRYSPNSISSIAAGNNLRKQMEIKSSISIPNISQSPDNQFSKSKVNKKKLFLYQIADADKNYLLKFHQYKHLKLTKQELQQQQENLENLKEKHKEEELKKLERYDQLKVSPEYCLMRKNSEELRRSQVQSAKSDHRKSQDSHSSSQIRVSYQALSGLLSQNINMNQSNNLEKDQFISSSTSSKVAVKGNPYSLESNPQKEEPYPPTPKKKIKSQIITTQITTSSATQPLQHPGIKNPYVISNTKKSKEGNINQNNIWNDEQDQQQKKSASQDNGKIKISQITYTTTTTTSTAKNNKNEKQDQANKGKQQKNNIDNDNDDKNVSNKPKNIQKQAQDRRNTDQNSQSDSNNKANSPSLEEKNKVPIGNYKIQQHEYNELFSKGKFKNDDNKKQINWDDKVIGNKNYPKNKLDEQQNDKNNQIINKQQQQQQQQKQPQNQQNYQNSIQNTYFQQKYSTQQPHNQIQQTKQHQQQVQPNNQQAKKQAEQQNKNKINQQPQNQKPTQQINLNNSISKSQISKSSQQNQDSYRGSDSNKSASPKQNINNYQQYNQHVDNQPQQEQDYQDQEYVQRPSLNNQKDNGDESDREKYNNQYNSDYNKMQGLGNLQGVQGKFTQFNAQGQQVVQNQKLQIQKRKPKVREQPPPPKKSEFVEQLEKEAQKDSKVEIRDEKVYLKPIESDDEPIFGYDSSDQEEEEQPQQTTQKRSSIRQTNSVSNNQKKRVSIKREEENYEQEEEEEEEEDETKYRKTPRTPFNKNDQEEEDQYN